MIIETDHPKTQRRIHGLDAYRGVLMMLGIVIHVGMIFFPAEWGGWSNYPATWESHIVAWSIHFVHIFRMPAFFVLAGFFAALLWKRYGLSGMLQNRYQRIVLPFVVFVFALGPAIDWGFTFLESATTANGWPWTLAYEAAEDKSFWPVDTMHLWFLYDLIWFTALSALLTYGLSKLRISGQWIKGWIQRTIESPWRSLLVFGLSNTVWWSLLRWTSIPTNTSWSTMSEAPVLLAYYFFIYAIGWMIYVSNIDVHSLERRAWTLTLLGAVCSIGSRVLEMYTWGFEEQEGVLPPPDIIAAFGTGVLCASIALVGLSRGLAGLFLRYANHGSPRWRYISDSSYWVYLVHLPLCGFVCAFVGQLPLPVLVLFPLGMLGVAALCFLSYDVMVRSTFWGRFLNGRTYPTRTRRRSAVVLVLTTGCLVAFPFEGQGEGERTSPWRDQGVPHELLPDEDVVDPLFDTPPVLPDVDLSRCIGVRDYAICPDGVHYTTAIAACMAMGGDFASIESEDEYNELADLIHRLTSSPMRLAITDEAEDGRWLWLTGTELNYAPWDDGQPDNSGGKESCMAMNFDGRKTWHDAGCDWEIGFVCTLPSAHDGE